MRRKNSLNQNDLDDLKRQNSHLEAQIRALERAKTAGNFSSAADILSDQGLLEEGESLPTDLGTSPAVRTAIAPGQSLLLTSPDNTADPPKKKVKQLWSWGDSITTIHFTILALDANLFQTFTSPRSKRDSFVRFAYYPITIFVDISSNSLCSVAPFDDDTPFMYMFHRLSSSLISLL